MFCRNSSGRPSTARSVVAGQRVHRVGAGAEGVHEDQRQGGGVLLARVQHLAGDDVEEREPAAHAQQRLRAVHAHRRAEATVELDHDRAADRVGGRVVGDLDVGDRLHVERVDGGLGDHPGLAVLEQSVVVGEDLDRGRVDAGARHLVASTMKTRGTHTTDRRLTPCLRNPRPAPPDPAAAPGDLAAAKTALRDQLVTARNRRSLAELAEAAERLTAQVLALPEVRRAASVSAYVSVGHEPGTSRLLDALLAAGKRVILPLTVRDPGGFLDLDWAVYSGPSSLAPARYGLLEPTTPALGPRRDRHARRPAAAGHGGVRAGLPDRQGRRLLRPRPGPGARRHLHLRAALRRRGRLAPYPSRRTIARCWLPPRPSGVTRF